MGFGKKFIDSKRGKHTECLSTRISKDLPKKGITFKKPARKPKIKQFA